MLSGVAISARIADVPACDALLQIGEAEAPAEGAKISTSLSMMKNTVSTSSRAERLWSRPGMPGMRRGACVLRSTSRLSEQAAGI